MPTPRATIRLSYLLELIAALAVGFAASRWAFELPIVAEVSMRPKLSVRWAIYLNPLIQSLAIVGLVGLAVEAIRGRRPADPGIGRWSWALAGGFVLIDGALQWYYWSIGVERNRGLPISSTTDEWLRMRLVWGTDTGLASALIAGCLAWVLARPPRGAGADGREWTGRLFGLAVVVWNGAVATLRWFDN